MSSAIHFPTLSGDGKHLLSSARLLTGLAASTATVEFRFFDPPRETKTGLKNVIVREIGRKVQCSTEGREMNFGSSYQEVQKIEFSRNRDSIVFKL